MELARVRAAMEPHYRLWLVTCPSCGASAARGGAGRGGGKGDLVRAYRRLRRTRKAVAALFWQLAAAVVLLGMVASGCIGIVNEMAGIGATPMAVAAALVSGDESRVRDWALNDGLFGFVFWSCFCVVAGMWLTAGLAHLSRVVWLVWAAALLVLVNIEWVLFPLLRAYGAFIGDPFTDHAPAEAVMQSRFVMAVVSLAAATGVGVPLGQRWAALMVLHRRTKMGRYRARRRRQQRGHAA
jgi:hypothetical protein